MPRTCFHGRIGANRSEATGPRPASRAKAGMSISGTNATVRAGRQTARAVIRLAVGSVIGVQLTAVTNTSNTSCIRYIVAQHTTVIAIVARITQALPTVHWHLMSVQARVIAGRSHPMVSTLRAVWRPGAQVSTRAAKVAVGRAVWNLAPDSTPSGLANARQGAAIAGSVTAAVQRNADGCVSNNAVDELDNRA